MAAHLCSTTLTPSSAVSAVSGKPALVLTHGSLLISARHRSLARMSSIKDSFFRVRALTCCRAGHYMAPTLVRISQAEHRAEAGSLLTFSLASQQRVLSRGTLETQ